MVETSPDGRFRFVKGGSGGEAGAAYDTENGRLVGWNELNLREMSPRERSSTVRSIDLLQRLSHEHVLGVYSHWEASRAGPMERQSRAMPWQAGQTSPAKGERLVFLTTPCITLENFVQTKVGFLRWRVVKRWSRQVIEALRFLHRQYTPVVHKNLSLSTIYIDPSTSHVFVGGVRNIMVAAPAASSSSLTATTETATVSSEQQQQQQDNHHQQYQHRHQHRQDGRPSRGRVGLRQKNWADRAWKLVSGRGGMACEEGGAAGFGGDDDDDDDDEEEDEDGREDYDFGAGEEGSPTAGARDIRAFGTVLIEMILKKRLNPALAQDERFLEVLPVISGWPASVVDFLRLCRAPADKRPSALDLLEHPFLELGNDVDDLPVYGDAELVAAAAAAAAATTPCPAGAIASSAAAAVAAAAAAAAANGIYNNPPPFSAPFRAAAAAAASAASVAGNPLFDGDGGSMSAYDETPALAGSKSPPWSPSSRTGAGRCGSCADSCSVGSPLPLPPSPSSPSPAAPSFGGAPTTPSSTTSLHYCPDLVTDGGGGGGGGGGQRGVLPSGATPAAYANAAAIASRMQREPGRACRPDPSNTVTAFYPAFYDPLGFSGDHDYNNSNNNNKNNNNNDDDDDGDCIDHNWSVHYPDRQHLMSRAGGGRSSGGSGGGSGG
ncbi:unnamed protein product, partial [Pylaiella littoralis]